MLEYCRYIEKRSLLHEFPIILNFISYILFRWNILTEDNYVWQLELYFSSIVKKNNVYGIQFHPEKSHEFGKKF